ERGRQRPQEASPQPHPQPRTSVELALDEDRKGDVCWQDLLEKSSCSSPHRVGHQEERQDGESKNDVDGKETAGHRGGRGPFVRGPCRGQIAAILPKPSDLFGVCVLECRRDEVCWRPLGRDVGTPSWLPVGQIERTEEATDIAAPGDGREIVKTFEHLCFGKRLEKTQGDGRAPDASTGQGEANDAGLFIEERVLDLLTPRLDERV